MSPVVTNCSFFDEMMKLTRPNSLKLVKYLEAASVSTSMSDTP